MQLEIKKVDIICPVYNKSQVVVDFIYSFVNNLDSEYFNLIIINDGSTDDSLSIISSIIKDKNGIYLFNKNNGGVSSARNYGLQLSVSEYIWFCDPDDLILSGGKEILDELASNLDIYIFRYITYFFEHHKKVESKSLGEGDMDFIEYFKNFDYFGKNNGISTLWNKIYKRKILQGVFFDEVLSNAEDRVFNITLLSNYNDGVCHLSNNIIYQHNRYKNGTLSTINSVKKIKDIEKANYINIEKLSEHKTVQKEKKRHIFIMCKEKVILGGGGVWSYYYSEHKKIKANFFPLESFSEILYIIPFFHYIYLSLKKIKNIIN